MTNTLTAAEAAERLGLSTGQLYKRLRRGDLSFTRDARNHYVIDEADVVRFAEAGQPRRSPTPWGKYYLSTTEAGMLLGRSPKTIIRWCHKGWLRYTCSPQGHVLVRCGDVRSLVGQRAQEDLTFRNSL